MAATMCLSDEEYDDMIGTGDDEAWEESDPADTNLPTKCFFCDLVSDSVDDSLAHCDSSHSFNMLKMCANNNNMDCFMFIKLVNFIRKKHISPTEIEVLLRGPSRPPWDSDEFMIPADPEDPFLQYDLESAVEELIRSVEETANGGVDCPEGEITIPKSEYEAVHRRLRDAESRAQQAEEGLARAMQDLQKLRNIAQTLVMNSENLSEKQALQSLTEEEDEAYFSSYAHFSIHEEMLKDKVRTESYRDFLFQNPSLIKDKIVLDVGCGTGILAMFAARAGAKQVIAVDQSEVIYQAMDIVKENGLEDIITFVKGRLEDVELPIDKVDIIISEWMGYFLLFESMLDTVLSARDKHLTPDGIVFPDRCTMSIAGVDDDSMHQAHIAFWDDVYGFKMSCMKKEVVREASVEIVSPSKLITQPCLLKDINVCLAKTSDLDFTSDLSLTVTKDGNLTALVGYFDIFFETRCDHQVKFSTSPGSDYSHWKQTVFLLDKPIPVIKDQVMTGTLSCRKDRKDPRNLIIGVKLQGQSYTFFMQ